MTCCRCIQNGNLHPVSDNFQHRRHQKTGIQRNSLPRLQIHCQTIPFFHSSNASLQPGNIVTLLGDMVSPSKIDPLHPGQVLTKFLFHRIQCTFKGIGILFAERVEMKTVNQRYQTASTVSFSGSRLLKALRCHAQPGARRTGIINSMSLLGGTLQIHPQTNTLPRCFCPDPKLFYLPPGIKHNVITIP